jgi:WD40 repeat protein
MLVFKAHSKPIYSIAFSPNGHFLLTSGGDETVRLWSVDLKQVQEWPGSRFWGPVAYSADGQFIARGGYGVQAWRVQESSDPFIDSSAFAEGLAFSPDSKVLAAHGEAGSIGLRRWAIPEGAQLPGNWGGTRQSNNGNQFPTGAVAYSPDGTLLAACYGVMGNRAFDSVVYLWDSQTGKQQGSLRSNFQAAHPTAICFSPDGRMLAAACGPCLRVWDIPTAKELVRLHAGKKHFKGLAFTPDGQRLVAVNNDAITRIWGVGSWPELEGYEWSIGKLGAVTVAPDGFRMAAGGSTGKVVIWDVKSD